MRGATAGLAVLCLAKAAGCAKESSSLASNVRDGATHYTDSRVKGSIDCGGRPVVLDGNRSVLRLTGPCRRVTVAGRRNDVHVEVAPGGLVEITGAHNNVTWRQVGEGRRPELRVVGPSNTFHADRRG